MPRNLFPGLVTERTQKGTARYRVRPEGNPRKKFTLLVGPDHPRFLSYYKMARRGLDPMLSENAKSEAIQSGDIEKSIRDCLSRSRERAKKKKVPFDLTAQFIADILDGQNYCCALSREQFDVSGFAKGYRRPRNISIDRIHPADGYVQSNVRLVTTIVNIALSDWGDKEFIRMCRSVSKAKVDPAL